MPPPSAWFWPSRLPRPSWIAPLSSSKLAFRWKHRWGGETPRPPGWPPKNSYKWSDGYGARPYKLAENLWANGVISPLLLGVGPFTTRSTSRGPPGP